MEYHLAEFLLLKRYCPLGQVGHLLISKSPASFRPADKQMAAPVLTVQFSPALLDASEFVEFISSKDSCTSEAAAQGCSSFFNSLLSLSGTGEVVIPGIGRFFVGPSGALQFRQQTIQSAFSPSVPAEKVIRANSSHSVLVGEREVASSEMAGKLKNTGRLTNPVYNYIAWFLAVLSLGLIGWYISQYGFSTHFGNRMQVKTKNPGSGYQSSQ